MCCCTSEFTATTLRRPIGQLAALMGVLEALKSYIKKTKKMAFNRDYLRNKYLKSDIFHQIFCYTIYIMITLVQNKLDRDFPIS